MLQKQHEKTISDFEHSRKLVEKTRQENRKKTDQLEKFQRDLVYLEERTRTLEYRGKVTCMTAHSDHAYVTYTHNDHVYVSHVCSQ